MLNEKELGTIKGLLHYLNDSGVLAGGDLAADVTIIDSNGESLGLIRKIDDEYQFLPGAVET